MVRKTKRVSRRTKEDLPITMPFILVPAFNFLSLSLGINRSKTARPLPHTANVQLAPQATGASEFKYSGDKRE